MNYPYDDESNLTLLTQSFDSESFVSAEAESALVGCHGPLLLRQHPRLDCPQELDVVLRSSLEHMPSQQVSHGLYLAFNKIDQSVEDFVSFFLPEECKTSSPPRARSRQATPKASPDIEVDYSNGENLILASSTTTSSSDLIAVVDDPTPMATKRCRLWFPPAPWRRSRPRQSSWWSSAPLAASTSSTSVSMQELAEDLLIVRPIPSDRKQFWNNWEVEDQARPSRLTQLQCWKARPPSDDDLTSAEQSIGTPVSQYVHEEEETAEDGERRIHTIRMRRIPTSDYQQL